MWDDLRRLYSFHFRDERRERLFLTMLGFGVTVGIVRTVTTMIRAGVGPVHNVTAVCTSITWFGGFCCCSLSGFAG